MHRRKLLEGNPWEVNNSFLLDIVSYPWSEHGFSSLFPKMFQQMEKKKQENKMRRDQLNDQYLELLEKQRLYFKTVKEFKEVRGGWGPWGWARFLFSTTPPDEPLQTRAFLWFSTGLKWK